MVNYDTHWLVDIVEKNRDVSTMELVRTHHLAGVALRPVDAVLKYSHTVWVLKILMRAGTHLPGV